MAEMYGVAPVFQSKGQTASCSSPTLCRPTLPSFSTPTQRFHARSPRTISDNPKFTFVGVGVEGDAEKLMCDHGLFVANTMDLNRLALLYYGEYMYGKMGLKRMAKALLGKVMEKPEDVTVFYTM